MANNPIADAELTHKFVAVLNKKIPVPNLMNALGHMAAGISNAYPRPEDLRYDTYTDRDGGVHPNISDNPFIVLQADNSNKIRTLRNECLAADVHFVDFTNIMTIGTYKEQHERMKETAETELEYYGIVLFGEKDKLAVLTKKFSLWR